MHCPVGCRQQCLQVGNWMETGDVTVGGVLDFFGRLAIIDYRLVTFDYDYRLVKKNFDRLSIKIDYLVHFSGPFLEGPKVQVQTPKKAKACLNSFIGMCMCLWDKGDGIR